jgi:hypothetical protein
MKTLFAALAMIGVLLGACDFAQAQSTINPNIPAANSSLSSAPVRANFQAAYNDINAIYTTLANPLALNRGGTNAALTASAGGIVYSGASSLAILAGTSTANQMLLSGSSAAPSWSTATWPSTAAQGTLLNAGTLNTWSATASPVLGVASVTNGSVGLASVSGGTATIDNPSAASAYNFNLPATAGTNGYLLTSAAGGASPMTWTSPTVTINGTNCTLASTCSVIASLGVGTSTISSGTNNGLLYDNAGVLGNLSTANDGVLATSSSGVPSITTAPVLGVGGSTAGTLGLANSGTGGAVVTVANPSATSAYNFNLPATAGTSTYVLTSAGGATSPMTWTSPTISVNSTNCTLGSSCTISASANSITVGTTSVNSGTSGYILYDNGGTLGNASIGTGLSLSGGTLALSTPVSLTNGGTGASLTASNGGIAYSTGSALAILAGTATAGQMLQSGATGAPSWSTATWPATTTANQLLYSSSSNTVAGLATGNNSVLVTSGTGVPSLSTTLPSGLTAPSLNVTTAFTATGLVTTGDLASQATNTVLGNATASSASPTALSVGSCSTASSALQWTTNTGFGCNTSITAAAVPASGLTGTTLASTVVSSSLTGVGTIGSGTWQGTPITGTYIASNTVANSNLAQSAAATLKGNPTASTANASDFTISGLTQSTTPDTANDYLLIWDHTAGTFKKINPSTIASSATAGVSSLNGLTGAMNLKATGGATITSSGTTVTIGEPGGLLNKFRNGTFDVWQRGTSSLSASTSGAYTADGWIVKQTGAAFTCARASGPTSTVGVLYSLQCVGGTSNTDTIVYERIESYIAAPLATSQTVTVQFYYQQTSGSAVTPKISTCYASAQDNFGTCTSDLSATSLTSCASGSWCLEAYTFTPSSSASNGYQVTFDCNTALTSSQYCYIAAADIRVTPGATNNAIPSVVAPPELRPIWSELSLSQRYFFSTYGNNVTPGTATRLGMACSGYPAVVYSGTFWAFFTQMRAAPGTLSIWDGAGNANKYSATTTGGLPNFSDNLGTLTTGNAGQNGFMATWNSSSGGAYCIHYTASSEL